MTNDAVQEDIRQENGRLEILTTTVKKMKVEMLWPGHKSQKSFWHHPTRYNLSQNNRQTESEMV